MEPPRQPNIVYASYSSPDTEAVLRVVGELQRRLDPHGIRVWMDKIDVKLGEDWFERIERVRNRARVWLVFWGPGAKAIPDNGSPGKYFRQELGLIERASAPRAIPVLLPGCNWSDAPRELRRRQGIQLTEHLLELEQLADRLREEDTSERVPDPSADPQARPAPSDLPPEIAWLLTPERMARLLARMALSYPDMLPCLQAPESATLHTTLRQLNIGALDGVLKLDQQLAERFHAFEPNALWLASVQTIHESRLTRVISSLKAMPLTTADPSAEPTNASPRE